MQKPAVGLKIMLNGQAVELLNEIEADRTPISHLEGEATLCRPSCRRGPGHSGL